MNWLAHLFLSDPHPRTRIGNLLPDILRQHELLALPPEFQRGITQHRRVDAFTDSHPIFRRSVQRFHAPFRRYAPLLVDVFYDHFLANDWTRYSTEDLNAFVSRFYASLDEEGHLLPPKAAQRLRQIRDGGWLLSYADPDGVATALRRTSLRLRKHVPLDDAVSILRDDYPGFRADFTEFFPLLQKHVAHHPPENNAV